MPARFERHGGPPNLVEAFRYFVCAVLNGRALDDNAANESAKGKFPDFAVFGDRLLIEMKHLESDQSERVQEVFEQKIKPEEKPIFYGTRDAAPIINSASNKNEILNALFNKLGRTIESQLRKANRQFLDYRGRVTIKNDISICVFLNSLIAEINPEAFVYCLNRILQNRERNSRSLFAGIDAVLYISEKHFISLPNGKPAFPSIVFGLEGLKTSPWKEQFVDQIVQRWAAFRTDGVVHVPRDKLNRSERVHDIPERMTRSEAHALEYARNPYLRELSNEKLREVFHRNMALSSMGFVKGDWPKPSSEIIHQLMREFTHIQQEINERNLDMRFFALNLLTPEERDRIYTGLPENFRRVVDKR